MPRYVEHPSRVARWRAGRFELHPDAARDDATVWFSTPGADGDVVWEGLNAISLPGGRARLVAIPVFVRGVGLGDEVETVASAEGAPVATGRVGDVRTRTLRVWFPQWAGDGPDERWRELQVELEPFDCWFDVFSPRLTAIAVEHSHAPAVEDVLGGGRNAGRFDVESGA